MSSTFTPTRRRARLPAVPVQVNAHLIGGHVRQDVIDGSAVLSIADMVTGAEKAYWLLAQRSGGRHTGFRLTAFGSGEVYDLPRDLSACTCADRTFAAGRPGGCRHMAGLRQALPAVPVALVAALPEPRRPDRKTERDELSAPEAA